MNKIALWLATLLVLSPALPVRAGSGQGKKPAVKAEPVHKKLAEAAKKPPAKCSVKPAAKPVAKIVGRAAEPPPAPLANEVPKPVTGDPDRERLERLQEALDAVVRGKVLGRLRVGMRVEDLASGRVLYGWRSNVLMDPASNQKVLATTAALLRLGSAFRYRTEVTGALPDAGGTVTGDIVLRGSGDPSLRPRHIDGLAEALVAQGVTRVAGAVLGDPRRIGADESGQTGRSPLRVGSTAVEVRVRPGDKAGSRPVVSVRPASDAFVVVNQAETRGKGKARLSVEVTRAGHRFQVDVGGRISMAKGEVVIYRAAPSQPLFAAVLLRHALVQAGIAVQGAAGVYSGADRSRVSRVPMIDGALVALGQQGSDMAPSLAGHDSSIAADVSILALHESETLPMLLRRVNKDSDNEWAERVLETVGAEVLGGAPTTAKGVRVLRESLADLGLATSAYLPANGSGLGHQNRVTAAGMAQLLRGLYFDPRVGPELMQSLSVGGVDGTTRNRFRGSSAAHRVRAKTGTLTGVSCLSGFVGDGSDILAFSILVEGHRQRAVPSVRGAQVSAVGAMMQFARRAAGVLPVDDGDPGSDLETGDEADEAEGPATEAGSGSEPAHSSPGFSGDPG